MINYRDFVSKRQAVTQALFSLEDDYDDVNAWGILRSVIEENRTTLDMLNYMTPFGTRMLSYCLQTMSEFEVDAEVCDAIASELNGWDIEDDCTGKWVFEKLQELYSRCGDVLIEVISKLRNEYIRQNPEVDCESIPNITPTLLNGAYNDSLFPYEEVDSYFEAVHIGVDVGHTGFIGVLFVFLNTRNLEHSNLWNFNSEVYVTYDHENEKSTFNLYGLFVELEDTLKYPSDDGETMTWGPLWMHSAVQSIELYSENIHLTDFSKKSNHVTVMPHTLHTRTTDYTFCPYVTHSRSSLPSSTLNNAPNGAVFLWSYDTFCNEGHRRILHSDAQMHDYGDDCIFIFSRASLTLVKENDHELQTVSLLNSIVDTIPCNIEFIYPKYLAFLGQQTDAEGDMQPLLVVDESDDPPRPFICYVLKKLTQYLLSSESTESDNLNTAVKPTWNDIRDYYED